MMELSLPRFPPSISLMAASIATISLSFEELPVFSPLSEGACATNREAAFYLLPVQAPPYSSRNKRHRQVITSQAQKETEEEMNPEKSLSGINLEASFVTKDLSKLQKEKSVAEIPPRISTIHPSLATFSKPSVPNDTSPHTNEGTKLLIFSPTRERSFG